MKKLPPYAALYLLALVPRVLVLVWVRGADAPLSGDMLDYHHIATSFLAGEGMQSRDGSLSRRPPLISFQLIAVYWVFGPSVAAARWSMVLSSALLPPVLFETLKAYLPRYLRFAPLLAAVAVAFYPPAVYYSTEVLTENMAAILTVAVLWAYARASSHASWKVAALLGMFAGLSTLNRPIFLLALPTLLLGELFVRSSWRLRPRHWAVAFGTMALAMAPWAARNSVLHGEFVPLGTSFGHMMLMSNANLDHPDVRAGMYFKNPEQYACCGLDTLPEVRRNDVMTAIAMEELRDNWEALPVPVLNRAWNFWTYRPDPFDASFTRNDLVMLLVWPPIVILFLVSLVVFPIRKSWPSLALIIYAFVFTLPFWGTPRFRYPVDPLIIAHAAVAVVVLLRRRRAVREGEADVRISADGSPTPGVRVWEWVRFKRWLAGPARHGDGRC